MLTAPSPGPRGTHRVASALQRCIGWALVVVGGLAIAGLTLVPGPPPPPPDPGADKSFCIACGSLGGVDVILNVLLFVPLGAGLGLLGVGWRRVVVIAGAFSGAVELAQLTVITGRDASVGDVLTNTLGGAVGWTLGHGWRGWILPGPRGGRSLAAAGGALWLGVLAATGLALRPAPTADAYYSQIQPSFPEEFDDFTGDVLRAWAGPVRLAQGRFPDTLRTRSELPTGQVRLRTLIGAGPRRATGRPAILTRIADGHRRSQTMLAQLGTGAWFESRLAAANLRLRGPAIELPGVFAPASEQARYGCVLSAPFTIEGRSEAGRYVLLARGACERRAEQPLRVTLGWALLLPVRWALGAATPLLSALWCALLVVPLGYWAGMWSRGRSPVRASLVAAAAIVAGLGALPLAIGAAPTGWLEWTGAAAGAGIALAIGRRIGEMTRRSAQPAVPGEPRPARGDGRSLASA